MTLDEVKNYFKNYREFMNQTGLSHNNYYNWKKQGYVPLRRQLMLEELTKGELKANIKDVNINLKRIKK